MKQFWLYCLVGGIGFFVELVLLSVLVQIVDFSPYWSRIPTFLLAVTVTWYANRLVTFSGIQHKDKRVQSAQYFLVQGGGALINLMCYMLMLYSFSWLESMPAFPLTVGAAVALVFNFLISKKYVFSTRKEVLDDR